MLFFHSVIQSVTPLEREMACAPCYKQPALFKSKLWVMQSNNVYGRLEAWRGHDKRENGISNSLPRGEIEQATWAFLNFTLVWLTRGAVFLVDARSRTNRRLFITASKETRSGRARLSPYKLHRGDFHGKTKQYIPVKLEEHRIKSCRETPHYQETGRVQSSQTLTH